MRFSAKFSVSSLGKDTEESRLRLARAFPCSESDVRLGNKPRSVGKKDKSLNLLLSRIIAVTDEHWRHTPSPSASSDSSSLSERDSVLKDSKLQRPLRNRISMI